MQDPAESQSSPLGESPAGPAVKKPRPGAQLVTDAAKRALTQEQAAKTLESFRQSCIAEGVEAGVLEETAERLRQAGYKQELAAALQEALMSPSAHPQVGALWMRRLVGSNMWDRRYPARMDELCERGEIGHRAVLEFLEIASIKRKARLVRRAVRRHAGRLRQCRPESPELFQPRDGLVWFGRKRHRYPPCGLCALPRFRRLRRRHRRGGRWQ